MGKIIINNKSNLTDLEVLGLVKSIVAEGRVSNKGKQYCYLTEFSLAKGNYQVATDLNKNSDKFIIL